MAVKLCNHRKQKDNLDKILKILVFNSYHLRFIYKHIKMRLIN